MFPFQPSLQKNITLFILALVAIALIISSPIGQVRANLNSKLEDSNRFNTISTIENNSPKNINKIDSSNPEEKLPGELTGKSYFSLSENSQNINDSRIETFNINMPQLEDRERTIIVYLPSEYASNDVAYPVIYLQGAQDVFTQNAMSVDKWILNESLYQFYTDEFDNDVIVVGIEYDSIHIWDEYTPWMNDDMYQWMDPYDANRVEGGEGDAYLTFLTQTLKQEIDSRYRTLTERENTAIAGYRMGGLFSLYAGLARSDIFSSVISLSPSIWFAEEGGSWLSRNRLLELIDTIIIPKDVNFTIDVDARDRITDLHVRPAVYDSRGNKISFPQAYLEGTRRVVEALLNKGIPHPNLNSGDINLDAWWDVMPEASGIEPTVKYTYYLPLISKHGLDHLNIYIPFENQTRRIWVYLPPDYFKSNKSYQVIYLTDAQHIFGSETGAHIADGFDWQFDEKLDELYEETGKGTIAVGIEFDYTHQWDEYMPWTNNNMDNWLDNVPDSIEGKGDLFLDFIINDLKPEIDSRYRTFADRDHTAIGGGSRGALFAFYAGLERPDIFSKVMSMSPAVWLAEGGVRTPNFVGYPRWLKFNQLVSWIRSHDIPKDVRFYLYIGEKETSGPPYPYPYAYLTDGTQLTMSEVYLRGAFKLRTEMLIDLGSSTTFEYIQNKNGTHRPSYWRLYVPSVMDWFGFY